MSSILAFSLIAGIPTVFAQNDTGMTSGGGDMVKYDTSPR